MSQFFFMHPHNTRGQNGLNEEIAIAQATLGEHNVSTNLLKVLANQIVIPRYRLLPWAKELEIEALERDASLINSYHEHRAIADVGTWWRDLWEVGLTPRRYAIEDYASLPEGEYFVKGETNSLKNNWFEACYAPHKDKLLEVIRINQMDSSIGTQAIQIQPFQHYRQIATAVDGRPVFNEVRVFVYKGDVLSYGNYWSSIEETQSVQPLDFKKLKKTLKETIELTRHHANFYVIDLAETPEGDWRVIELNDGVMSGLSENRPEEVFGKLFKIYGK